MRCHAHNPVAAHRHVAGERRRVARKDGAATDQQVHRRHGRGAEQQEGKEQAHRSVNVTGGGAAVANAVFNATGKRVRDLPITLDKLL